MKKETAFVTTSELSDEVIDKLIEDHWREIRGLLAELRKRGKHYGVSNSNR